MNHLDRLLTAIAGQHLGIATLETRQSDALDFHEVSVWGLKHALAAAYQAGENEYTGRPPATPAGHTPEPWYVDGLAGNETQLWIRTLDRPIATIRLGKDPGGDQANACRLVACVNACAGIAT